MYSKSLWAIDLTFHVGFRFAVAEGDGAQDANLFSDFGGPYMAQK